MGNRLEEFLRQAENARARAVLAEGEFKQQWLRVAEMWELLAREYGRVRRIEPNGEA